MDGLAAPGGHGRGEELLSAADQDRGRREFWTVGDLRAADIDPSRNVHEINHDHFVAHTRRYATSLPDLRKNCFDRAIGPRRRCSVSELRPPVVLASDSS